MHIDIDIIENEDEDEDDDSKLYKYISYETDEESKIDPELLIMYEKACAKLTLQELYQEEEELMTEYHTEIISSTQHIEKCLMMHLLLKLNLFDIYIVNYNLQKLEYQCIIPQYGILMLMKILQIFLHISMNLTKCLICKKGKGDFLYDQFCNSLP